MMTSNAILREQTLSEQVLSMNEHMEELAAAEEWSHISDLMSKRNAMLQVIEDGCLEPALVAARRTTDRIQRMAEKSRKQVADKLAKLQRGKVATDSYRAHA